MCRDDLAGSEDESLEAKATLFSVSHSRRRVEEESRSFTVSIE